MDWNPKSPTKLKGGRGRMLTERDRKKWLRENAGTLTVRLLSPEELANRRAAREENR